MTELLGVKRNWAEKACELIIKAVIRIPKAGTVFFIMISNRQAFGMLFVVSCMLDFACWML